jgi:hypothetical protein
VVQAKHTMIDMQPFDAMLSLCQTCMPVSACERHICSWRIPGNTTQPHQQPQDCNNSHCNSSCTAVIHSTNSTRVRACQTNGSLFVQAARSHSFPHADQNGATLHCQHSYCSVLCTALQQATCHPLSCNTLAQILRHCNRPAQPMCQQNISGFNCCVFN